MPAARQCALESEYAILLEVLDYGCADAQRLRSEVKLVPALDERDVLTACLTATIEGAQMIALDAEAAATPMEISQGLVWAISTPAAGRQKGAPTSIRHSAGSSRTRCSAAGVGSRYTCR